MVTFNDLKLDEDVLKALGRMGYSEPTPIQAQAIPLVLEGNDVIGLAQTGSGKTAACAIPVCNKVDTSRPEIQALIVVPTRELALQYATETQKIGKERGVKAFALFGGEDYELQHAKLRHGVQILIATPGRLIDFIYSRSITLDKVETVILDEADEMLGMGFYEDLEFIFQCLIHDHQTLLFSATMPKQIKAIAQNHMQQPKEVRLIQNQVAPDRISHQFIFCRRDQKGQKIQDLTRQVDAKQGIIFCASRREVERLCKYLQGHIRGVDLLHGGMSQDLRTTITGKFRAGKIRFLVATDVAARGLDFSGVTHVFIYDLTSDIDSYIHRSGRTGRHDRHGMVITLVTDRELRLVPRIEKRLQREITWLEPPPQKDASKPRTNGTAKPRSRSSGSRPAAKSDSSTEKKPRKRRPPRKPRSEKPASEAPSKAVD